MAGLRQLNWMKQPMWYKRIALGSTSPVKAPLHIKPTAAPSGTAEAGDIYVNSTSGGLLLHNGTSFAPVGSRVAPKTAAATLTAADNGAVCIFNAAAGFTYTLPSAEPGLRFRFQVQTTATSLVHRIACASGDFFLGTILQATDGTYTIAARDADGSTHLAWEGNGSTTGGIKGDWIEVVAISTSQWAVSGYNSATGSEATPWKTS